MSFLTTFNLLLATIWLTEGFLLDSELPNLQTSRNLTKMLIVHNGDRWGDWTAAEFCEEGTYASGYRMKIESFQYKGDDTELNGIELHCEKPDTEPREAAPGVTSGQGSWGSWLGLDLCDENATMATHFLQSFALQSEPEQGSGDDTAATFIKFQCRAFNENDQQKELAHGTGHEIFGVFGRWSESCPDGSAICGLQTRIEAPQGNGDDTALNDVKMFCCYHGNAQL